jgi:hypothetical protein
VGGKEKVMSQEMVSLAEDFEVDATNFATLFKHDDQAELSEHCWLAVREQSLPFSKLLTTKE